MARSRVRQAVRKAAARALAQPPTEAREIAAGVFHVAEAIAPLVKPGALYWSAPIQYVCEQMAARVVRAHGLEPAELENVAGYLTAGVNEYIVALVGEFDNEHFRAWIAAQDQQLARIQSGTDT